MPLLFTHTVYGQIHSFSRALDKRECLVIIRDYLC